MREMLRLMVSEQLFLHGYPFADIEDTPNKSLPMLRDCIMRAM